MHVDTYARLLQVCIDSQAFPQAKAIHSLIIKSRFVSTHAKCSNVSNGSQAFGNSGRVERGNREDARQVFDKMPERSVISWNTNITRYARNGQCFEALEQYKEMHKAGIRPSQFTFVSVLNVCTRVSALELGKQVHAQILMNGPGLNGFVGSALVNMYAKCGITDDARLMFDKLPERDTVTWTAMISGYSQGGHSLEAIRLFREMQLTEEKPDQVTYVGILSACASKAALKEGIQLHAQIVKTGYNCNLFVSSALLDVYAKCDHLRDARQLFDKMPERDAVLWNAMITGYSQNEDAQEGLKLFVQMQKAGARPDIVTFTGVLNCWATLAGLEGGKQVHCHVVRSGFESNVCVGNSLIDMYVKCASTEDASQFFQRMPQRTVVSWNAMIGGYAINGLGREALHLFERMVLEGTAKPNGSTFVSVLSACNYAGLVDEGRHYFSSMSRDHCIMPRLDHYGCFIDLLARAGHLDEAEDIIDDMPFEANAVVWGAVLGACRNHGNIELGERAAKALFELEPQDATPYVLLSYMYAAADRWDDAAKVRKTMKDRGVEKTPGCSWIEVTNRARASVADS